MVKDICPKCGSDWIQNYGRSIKNRRCFDYKKCLTCGRMFTIDFAFELKKVKKK